MIFCKHNLKNLLICWMSFSLLGCSGNYGILNPKGLVAFIERQLLFDTTALMLIVIIPVIIISIDFTYHYREKNHIKQITSRKVEYKPNWSHNNFYESLWWSIPCLIVLALAFVSWHYTHKLDPYRKLQYPGELVHVQVISLPWKWLFIYPEHNIATINHLVIPNDQQIAFVLTTDNVPMSSFFIPQLGSQIYTMAGMQTQLHLVANETGQLRGLNSQYNGVGFSEMHFIVDVVEHEDFNLWVKQMKGSAESLSINKYNEIRQPQINVQAQYFAGVQENLFNEVVVSYMSLTHPNQI